MQGFYANLLTKNVAMGGDVDAHAVSVYTAGSARQTHLLDTPASQSAHSGNKEMGNLPEKEDHGAAEEEDFEEMQGVSSVYQDTRAAHLDRELVGEKRRLNIDDRPESAAEQPSKKQSLPSSAAEHVVEGVRGAAGEAIPSAVPLVPTEAPSVPAPTPSPAAAVVDRGEQIMSAKDRYLARKKAAAQGST
jgi:hypothetical protein